MKYQTALKIIRSKDDWRGAYGFRVSMDHRYNGVIAGDGFPDINRQPPEAPIAHLDKALSLAKQFAGKVNPAEYVNIHVVHAKDLKHVDTPENIVFNPY